ncbi:hypothetical protein [Rhodococcus kronopolitis]|uniref:Uncharacterized protein n=1 Tax=Rhodococcus kronopolitis TaxID=1460226 RepID=A0ABV9FQT7_9NOCA
MTTRNRYYPPIQGELEDEGFSADREDFAPGGAGEFEFEAEAYAAVHGEHEGEEEGEAFVNPVRRVYRDAETMAHLATRAGRTDSEAEAEAFIGALVPLAARLVPRAASIVAANAPAMIRGAARIARTLRHDPATRALVGALPVVLQRTAQSLADQAASGAAIDSSTVARTLGTMTQRVLAPSARGRSIRAVGVFDDRWHRAHRAAARQRVQPVYQSVAVRRRVHRR